jgi:site-specific DNA recombinase
MELVLKTIERLGGRNVPLTTLMASLPSAPRHIHMTYIELTVRHYFSNYTLEENMPAKSTKSPLKSKPSHADTRAAIYVRVSTDEQATDGYGLAVQRERCAAMALVKGWQVVTTYADEGISGTKDASERPGLAALLAAADAGEIDTVIVLALDRLGRKTSLVLDLVERLSAANVALVSCKESLDTTTSAGQFTLTIFAALAQLERDTIVERTTAGRNQRGKADGEKGGRLPYGYRRTAVEIVVDEEAAANVAHIFALRSNGASLWTIARSLSGPSPRGGAWYPSGISNILRNESAYKGGPRGESNVHWPTIL